MKRQRDRFPWPLFEEEFDVAEYFTRLEKHKFRFFLFIFFAIASSFVYFKYFHIKGTESQLAVDIGFSSIKQGTYPDGSIFEKNDIVADSILSGVYNNIPELADGNRWRRQNFNSFFLVESVYPMDIVLAKKTLTDGSAKPEETVENYDKVRSYVPTQYIVSFRPVPMMPDSLKNKVFEELVRQFRKEVLENHYWGTQFRREAYNNSASVTANYDGLANRVSRLNTFMRQFAGEAGDQSVSGNSQRRGNLSRWQGATEFTASLSDLNADIASLDTMMLDDKLLPNVDAYRKQLEAQIANINFEIRRVEKQADFRLRLAELTKGTSKDGQTLPQVEPASAEGTAQKQQGYFLDMLLSYGPKYYSMIDDTRAMFDKKTDLENQRDIAQYRLNRLNAPSKVTVAKPVTQEEMAEKLKKIFANLSMLEKNVGDAYRKGMAEYESPISRYVVMHQEYAFPVKSAALWAAIMAAIFCGLQAAIIYLRQVVSGKAEEKPAQVNVVSAKLSGKN